MGLVFVVKVLCQLVQKQWVLEYSLDWLYQLRAEREGVADPQLAALWSKESVTSNNEHTQSESSLYSHCCLVV